MRDNIQTSAVVIERKVFIAMNLSSSKETLLSLDIAKGFWVVPSLMGPFHQDGELSFTKLLEPRVSQEIQYYL